MPDKAPPDLELEWLVVKALMEAAAQPLDDGRMRSYDHEPSQRRQPGPLAALRRPDRGMLVG